MLLWSGARCCTSTKAIPGSVSAGTPEKKASKAASPPAEAPMPTTGKPTAPVSGDCATGGAISGESLDAVFAAALRRLPCLRFLSSMTGFLFGYNGSCEEFTLGSECKASVRLFYGFVIATRPNPADTAHGY